MNPISELRKEHIAIERELFELDSIMEDEIINYPNLVHTFRKLCDIWDHHEHEEQKIFAVMEKEQIRVPVHIMTCEHKDISGHILGLKNSINSGNDAKVKESLDKDLSVIVKKIREHMNKEDEILYTIALNEFTDEELAEMSRAIEEERA
jgi:DUF438 domain-containing protein